MRQGCSDAPHAWPLAHTGNRRVQRGLDLLSFLLVSWSLLVPPQKPPDAGREYQEHDRGDRVEIDVGGEGDHDDRERQRDSHGTPDGRIPIAEEEGNWTLVDP